VANWNRPTTRRRARPAGVAKRGLSPTSRS
jgi:hypothetical protein